MVRAILKGDLARLKRERDDAVIAGRWAGLFAQADPKQHDRLLKSILTDKKKPRLPMTGKQIGAALRVFAAKTGG